MYRWEQPLRSISPGASCSNRSDHGDQGFLAMMKQGCVLCITQLPPLSASGTQQSDPKPFVPYKGKNYKMIFCLCL